MKRIASVTMAVLFLASIGVGCGSMNRYGMAKRKKHVKIIKKYKKGCGCTGKKK